MVREMDVPPSSAGDTCRSLWLFLEHQPWRSVVFSTIGLVAGIRAGLGIALWRAPRNRKSIKDRSLNDE